MDIKVVIRSGKKLAVVLFACVVFIYLLRSGKGYSPELELREKFFVSIICLLLLQVVIYFEILFLRDQMWVLEGSLKMMRDLRDSFLEPADSAFSSFKKFIVIFNALLIVGFFVYLKRETPIVQATVGILILLLLLVILLLETMIIRTQNEAIAEILQKREEFLTVEGEAVLTENPVKQPPSQVEPPVS